MNEKYYKSSGRFSWKGIILMFLTYLVVGTGLSWVYLWINRISPSVYLCIFAAIGFGAAVGLIARLFVKLFKVRNVVAVLVGAALGLTCMTYLKWAIYDYYDYVQINEQFEESVESNSYIDDMKQEKAYTYFQMDIDFDETQGTFDENWDYLATTNAYDYISMYDQLYQTNVLSSFTSSEQAEMKTQTLYEFYDYDEFLGKTKEECKANLEKAKELTAYEFYYEYRNLAEKGEFGFEAPSLIDIVKDPGMLWKDIKQIAKEGRWSISSSSPSSHANDASFKGVMLWVVWIAELLVIVVIALVIPIGQAKKIFIEMDNDWAKTTDGNRFTFSPMSKSQVKAMLEQTPDNIVNMMIVRPQDIPVGRPYSKVTLSHSEDFTEAYLNVLSMTYNAKNKNYVSSNLLTGLRLRPKHTGMLFTMFGLTVPSRIAADAEFIEWDRARAAQVNSMMSAPQQTAPQQVPVYASQRKDDDFDQDAYEAWRRAKLQENNTAGDMDGISTDDIDTDIL